MGGMRTTITLDPDTQAIVDDLRRRRGSGVSAVVNELIRAGAAAKTPSVDFRQRTARLGHSLVDVANVAEALEVAEGLG